MKNLKDAIGRLIDRVGKKAMESIPLNNVIQRIYHGKLFKAVYSRFERVRAGKMLQEIKHHSIPGHVAIIMDGNRRFARELGLNPSMGHELGADKLEEVVEWCLNDVGIKVLTVYAFSTENFDRADKEVKLLMDLIAKNLKELAENDRIHKNRVRIQIIGRLSSLPTKVKKAAEYAMESTKGYDDHYFNVAIAYGGREEIIQAIKRIVKDVKEGKLEIEDLKDDIMSSYLYTSNLPDPDLILRTSGEERISNFLLWQLAYSELYFADVYWPALKKTDLLKAIKSYQERQKRYGG